MKQKSLILLSLISVLSMSVVPFIQAKTASPSATPVQIDSKIENLKERLATRVAELRKTSPKAISGTVSAVSISNITIDTITKAVKIEITDSINVYQILKGKRTKLTTDDVSKGDTITVFGDYDETLDSLSANTIFIEAPKPLQRIHGAVSDIDKKNNTLTVKGDDGTTYTADIQSTTKMLSWTPDGGIVKSGFSKIEIGMFVSVLGLPDTKDPTFISATRLLHLKTKVDATPTVTITPTQPATPSATPSKKPTTTTGKVKPTATPTP